MVVTVEKGGVCPFVGRSGVRTKYSGCVSVIEVTQLVDHTLTDVTLKLPHLYQLIWGSSPLIG